MLYNNEQSSFLIEAVNNASFDVEIKDDGACILVEKTIKIERNIIMQVIVSIIGTITTIITIILTNYLSKKKELKFSERKLKENYYLQYINAISNNANYNDVKSVLEENKAFNNLILISSETVLKKLYEFQTLRIDHFKKNSISNYNEEYDRLFTELIREIRNDLYNKKENIPNIYILGGVLTEDKSILK